MYAEVSIDTLLVHSMILHSLRPPRHILPPQSLPLAAGSSFRTKLSSFCYSVGNWESFLLVTRKIASSGISDLNWVVDDRVPNAVKEQICMSIVFWFEGCPFKLRCKVTHSIPDHLSNFQESRRILCSSILLQLGK